MYVDADEAAYVSGRLARSIALANRSTDVCARASHDGIAAAYRDRLAELPLLGDRSPGMPPIIAGRPTDAG